MVQNAIGSPCPPQDLYLRVRERSGSQSARVAVARKLAILAYLAWKFPEVGDLAGVAPERPWSNKALLLIERSHY